jgi:hypothetical protein
MRRTILLSLFALLAVGRAHDAGAQHRGAMGRGLARGGHGYSRAWFVSPYAFGDADPYYDLGATDPYAPQPILFLEQSPRLAQPPAPPVTPPQGHSEVTEYKWPDSGSSTSVDSGSEPPSFAIVLKDGSTLSAVMVFASDDGLHYVDPDERHLRVSISEVDRAATIKLNRQRNLNLQLPAAQ